MAEFALEASWPLPYSLIGNAEHLYEVCTLGTLAAGEALTEDTTKTIAGRLLESTTSARLCGSYFVILNHEVGHTSLLFHQTGKWGKIFFNPFENLLWGSGLAHPVGGEGRSITSSLLVIAGGINFSYLLGEKSLQAAADGSIEEGRGHHHAMLQVIAQWTSSIYFLRALPHKEALEHFIVRRSPVWWYGIPPRNVEEAETFSAQEIGSTGISNDVVNYAQLAGLRNGRRVEVINEDRDHRQYRETHIAKDAFYNFYPQIFVGGLLSTLDPATLWSFYRAADYIVTGDDTYRLPWYLPHYKMTLGPLSPLHEVEMYLPQGNTVWIPRASFGYGYDTSVGAGLEVTGLPFTDSLSATVEAEGWKQGEMVGGYLKGGLAWQIGPFKLEGGVFGKSVGFHPLSATLAPETGTFASIAYQTSSSSK